MSKRDLAVRISMLTIAALFLITSVGLSIFVIWQEKRDKDAANAAAVAQAALEESQNNTPKEGALKGTPLADFTPITEPVTELQIIDLKEGDGQEVKKGDTVTAHYTGAYAVNGEIFESSKDSGQPATFPLANVIKGWQNGVPGMKVGGIRRLVIPGADAYGEAPEGYTPGSTSRPMGPLVFDIELQSIGQ